MLATALILDALVGDPPGLWSRIPHPVVLIGRLVAWLESRLNNGAARRRRGALAVAILLGLTLAPALLHIHRELKRQFDPAGIFNPGRLYAEI